MSVDGIDEKDGFKKHFGNVSWISNVCNGINCKLRFNWVMNKDNEHLLGDWLEICNDRKYAISLGFAVPKNRVELRSDYNYVADDEVQLARLIDTIEGFRDRGCKIIDPPKYFKGYFKYLRGERFWKCNYGKRFGWINVDSSGYVLDCTRKMKQMDFFFPNVDRGDLGNIRRQLKDGIPECNDECYSNCAFDSYYYGRHPIKLARLLNRNEFRGHHT